jgi:hypothetical protein
MKTTKKRVVPSDESEAEDKGEKVNLGNAEFMWLCSLIIYPSASCKTGKVQQRSSPSNSKEDQTQRLLQAEVPDTRKGENAATFSRMNRDP